MHIAEPLTKGKGTWSVCFQINWELLRRDTRTWELKYMASHKRKPLADDLEVDRCEQGSPQPSSPRLTDEGPNPFPTHFNNPARGFFIGVLEAVNNDSHSRHGTGRNRRGSYGRRLNEEFPHASSSRPAAVPISSFWRASRTLDDEILCLGQSGAR